MKNMFKNVSLAVAFSILGGASVSQTAQAERKLYSTDGCRGRKATPDVDIWRGRTFNYGPAAQHVHCPIVRSGFDATPDNRLWMKVVDRNSNDDVVCAIWTQNTESSDGWNGTVVSRRSSGSADVVQTLFYTPLRALSATASYTIECSVPAMQSGNASQIVAYSTDET